MLATESQALIESTNVLCSVHNVPILHTHKVCVFVATLPAAALPVWTRNGTGICYDHEKGRCPRQGHPAIVTFSLEKLRVNGHFRGVT
jgi:hypothetical protein